MSGVVSTCPSSSLSSEARVYRPSVKRYTLTTSRSVSTTQYSLTPNRSYSRSFVREIDEQLSHDSLMFPIR